MDAGMGICHRRRGRFPDAVAMNFDNLYRHIAKTEIERHGGSWEALSDEKRYEACFLVRLAEIGSIRRLLPVGDIPPDSGNILVPRDQKAD